MDRAISGFAVILGLVGMILSAWGDYDILTGLLGAAKAGSLLGVVVFGILGYLFFFALIGIFIICFIIFFAGLSD